MCKYNIIFVICSVKTNVYMFVIVLHPKQTFKRKIYSVDQVQIILPVIWKNHEEGLKCYTYLYLSITYNLQMYTFLTDGIILVTWNVFDIKKTKYNLTNIISH